jgi:hypothetical protein
MNDLAVARGDSGADAERLLGDDDVMTGARRRPRAGQPDHASADNKNLHVLCRENREG